jgi:hypothetical protein
MDLSPTQISSLLQAETPASDNNFVASFVAEVNPIEPTESSEETKTFTEEEEREIIADIVETSKKSYEKYKDEYERQREDRKFFSGEDVYTKEDDINRGADRTKSILNILNTPFHAIVNSFRKSPYSLRLSSEDDNLRQFASETGKTLKSIEDNSNYKQIYSQALGDAVIGGRGYIYLSTDEFPDGSSNIMINAAQDPTMVIYDACMERGQSFADAAYAGFIQFVPNETIRNKYPDIGFPEDSTLERHIPAVNGISTMCTPPKDSSVVLNYFVKDYSEPEEISVIYYKIIGDKIASYVKFKGLSKIPAAPFYGNEYWKEEKRIYKGIVRDSKECCSIINYTHSQLKERLSTPTTPFIFCGKTATEGFFDSDYRDGNRSLSPVKRYQDFAKDGVKVDPPTFVSPTYKTDDISSIITMEISLIETMIGIGVKGIQTSEQGKAETAEEILQNVNSSVNNMTNFYEAAKAAIKYIGEVIVEIIGLEQGMTEVDMMPLRVSVTEGPELVLEKTERRRQLLALAGIVPDTMKPLILAEVIRTMDMPNAEQLYKIAFNALPDNLKGEQAIPQVAQQQIKQLEQQNQELKNNLSTTIKTLEDANSKLYIAETSNSNEVLIARLQNENALRLELMKAAQSDKAAQQDLMAEAISLRQQAENDIKLVKVKAATSVIVDNNKKEPKYVPVPVQSSEGSQGLPPENPEYNLEQ